MRRLELNALLLVTCFMIKYAVTEVEVVAFCCLVQNWPWPFTLLGKRPCLSLLNYCHRRKQQSQGSHYLSDTVVWKTPSNGSHLSQRIRWIPRINCAVIWTFPPHCRRHEYTRGRPRWCRRYKVFRSPELHGANTACDYTNSPFWTG